MRSLIVDDEAPARARLRRLLLDAGGVEIVGEATTGREAIALIKRTAPDVVFLDIHMPGLDGFGVLDAIADDRAPHVVFVTAAEQHALRAFEAGAADYLLKPYTRERFGRMLSRARARVGERHALNHSDEQARASQPVTYLRRLLLVEDGRALLLPVDRIERIESERNYVYVVSGKSRHRLRAPIGAIEARLDPAHFLRVNRSTVIRLDAVLEIHEWSHGDYRVVMRDGSEVVWSRRYRAAARRDFGVEG